MKNIGKKDSSGKRPATPVAVPHVRLRRFVKFAVSSAVSVKKRPELLPPETSKTDKTVRKIRKPKVGGHKGKAGALKTAGAMTPENGASRPAIGRFFKKCRIKQKKPKKISKNSEIIYVPQYGSQPIQKVAGPVKQGNVTDFGAPVKTIDLKTATFSRTALLKNSGVKEEDIKRINISYPLTPFNPKKGEKVYAWCNIKYDSGENCLVYKVIEPPLTEFDKKEISRIKDIIEEKIDIRFEAIESGSSIVYLRKAIDGIIKQFGISLTNEQKMNYEYYILRDFVGLGKFQPLLNDQNIEDISCDGTDIPIFVYHRNQKIASIKTNVVFDSKDVLNDFVMKLAQRCGRAVSVADPILEGALPDGSRVQAILETDIARRGSNITIRKFSKKPITPVHLLGYHSADAQILAYLWYLVEHRCSILVSGPTASGKTSLLNALSLFIHPSMKVVSIEDTPELRLPHAHWVPEISREGFGIGDSKIGEVSLFELLKSALRQRPDYIIVGEVRGQEAYILFQAMATGHAGLSTIHADSIEKVIDRLTTPPINLPASLVETLNAIVFIKRIRHGKAYVRRIFEVHEIVGYDLNTKQPKTRLIFRWDPLDDKFNIISDSEVLGMICENEGISETEMKKDLFSRKKLLEWLNEQGISDYRDVGSILAEYYSDDEKVMDIVI